MKPEKRVYENQSAVRDAVLTYLHENICSNACVEKAWLWGSAAEGTFGVYDSAHRDHSASDIDVVILVDESYGIPSSWKDMQTEKPSFSLYRIGEFKWEKQAHIVEGLMMFPSKHASDRLIEKVEKEGMKIK